MSRAMVALAAALVLVLVGSVALTEEKTEPAQSEGSTFDIGTVANRVFADLALLPTRLTAYNSHDDSATASYTCCRPDQEVEIERALKANADFVQLYPTSDFADDALFHSGRVNSVKRDMLREMASWRAIVENHPGSDLWDDAIWNLANCYARDKDRAPEIQLLNLLIARRPYSMNADDACLALNRAYMDLRDEQGALASLQRLATQYLTSEYCDDAMFAVAAKYQEVGSYEQAIAGHRELLSYFPMSDYVDDAQMGIADCFRALHNQRDAFAAYMFLIQRMPGSPLVRRAMTEVNTFRPDTFNLKGHFPCDDAQDLIDLCEHYENYNQYADSIAAAMQFIRLYPGHDWYDDAWYHVGTCYKRLDKVFQRIDNAKGPDDLFRLTEDFQRGTAMSTIPNDRQLSATGDAVSAFAVVVNNLVGSNLREEALREIATCYEQANMEDEAAYTYEEMVVHCPYATEPDDGDQRGKGAILKSVRWLGNPEHYVAAGPRYAMLARAYPDIFPPNLYQSRDEFLALMKLYERHADHAFMEMRHHIPYRVSMDDLRQDAAYYLACLNMERGEYRLAVKQLRPFLDSRSDIGPTSDFGAPAAYLYARAQEIMGGKDKAAQAYQLILDLHNLSGLADDAKAGLERLAAGGFPAEVQALATKVGSELGVDVSRCDAWVGDNAVVIAPWPVTAKMRQYNMPNIWDEAQRQLHAWTGTKPTERVVMYLDGNGGQNEGGNPVRVSAWAIDDPPQWNLGLVQIARNAVLATKSKALAQTPVFADALAKFAAAALQYQLVTETRDTIGSASAVKLPQEEVLRARDGALAALEEYVRQEPDPEKLNSDVIAGMLFSLLDQNGYSKQSLIDWEPYARFFEAIARAEAKVNPTDPKDVQNLFVYGMNQAFGADCTKQFKSWGFRVDAGRLTAIAGRA